MKLMTNKKLGTFLAATMAFLVAGCWQKSLHPFCHEKDVIDDPGLAGIWTEPGEDAKTTVWTFSAAGERRYKLNLKDGEINADFEARLFKLGGDTFLNLYSEKRSMSEIPVHHLLKISREGDLLSMKVLNLDWVQKWLRQNPDKLAHIRVSDPAKRDDRDSDELVLAASTDALQKFLLDHRETPELFDGDGKLQREAQAVAAK
jgi:hypothetical protein